MAEPVLTSEQTAVLVSIAGRLGVSSNRCLSEAIDDWVKIVAPARLEEVSHLEKLKTVVEFPMKKAS